MFWANGETTEFQVSVGFASETDLIGPNGPMKQLVSVQMLESFENGGERSPALRPIRGGLGSKGATRRIFFDEPRAACFEFAAQCLGIRFRDQSVVEHTQHMRVVDKGQRSPCRDQFKVPIHRLAVRASLIGPQDDRRTTIDVLGPPNPGFRAVHETFFESEWTKRVHRGGNPRVRRSH